MANSQQYGIFPYTAFRRIFSRSCVMVAIARLDLKLEPADKAFVSRAAALQGTTVAEFVRQAAREKAFAVLDHDAKVKVSTRDYEAMIIALQVGFKPNPALSKAIKATKSIKRA